VRSLPGFEPLAGMCPLLAVQQPTLMVEVLPEAAQPGALLSSLTMEAGSGWRHEPHIRTALIVRLAQVQETDR